MPNVRQNEIKLPGGIQAYPDTAAPARAKPSLSHVDFKTDSDLEKVELAALRAGFHASSGNADRDMNDERRDFPRIA